MGGSDDGFVQDSARAGELPPVCDPAIVRAADDAYFLTGTHGINSLNLQHADFQNNDGVRLWKSKDLKNWENVGLVWSPTGFSPFHRGVDEFHAAGSRSQR